MKRNHIKLSVLGATIALTMMVSAVPAFAANVENRQIVATQVQTTEPTFGTEGSIEKGKNHVEPFLNNGESTVVLNGRTFSIGKSGTVKYKGKQIAHIENGQIVIDDASYKLG